MRHGIRSCSLSLCCLRTSSALSCYIFPFCYSNQIKKKKKFPFDFLAESDSILRLSRDSRHWAELMLCGDFNYISHLNWNNFISCGRKHIHFTTMADLVSITKVIRFLYFKYIVHVFPAQWCQSCTVGMFWKCQSRKISERILI